MDSSSGIALRAEAERFITPIQAQKEAECIAAAAAARLT